MTHISKLYVTKPDKKRRYPSRIPKKHFPLSSHPQVNGILFLQRTIGNQAVKKLIHSKTLQTRLSGHDNLKSGDPFKSIGGELEEHEEKKPNPNAGSATIQCNGKGGYEVVLNSWATAKCGTKKCVIKHERSHISDWKAQWPAGCKGQPKGYLPKGDPPDKPLMTVAEYNAFLKKSECKAHKADLKCANALPKPAGCKKTVEDYIKLTKAQKKKWC